MELVYIFLFIIVGLILVLFNKKIIKLIGADKYINYKQDRNRKIVAGIGLIIIGLWQLSKYFGFLE